MEQEYPFGEEFNECVKEIVKMANTYTPPVGLNKIHAQSQAAGAMLGSRPPQITLAQRINDKINRLQGQVEELQLVRSKLQAGKLDSITMDDLSKIFDY